RDRKNHALAKAVIGQRNVLPRDQQSGLYHRVCRYPQLSQVLLERKSLVRSVADPKFQLGLRVDPPIAEVAARLRTCARGKACLEEFCSELDDLVERLAALLAGRLLAGQFRQRKA